MNTMVFAMGVVVVVIGLAGALWFGEIDARRVREEADGFSLYLQAQVKEMKMRERRLHRPRFLVFRVAAFQGTRWERENRRQIPDPTQGIIPDLAVRALSV